MMKWTLITSQTSCTSQEIPKLYISASLEVRSDLDDGETKNIFNKALELVNEKFSLPDVRIRELHIYEDPLYMMRRPRFSISYSENGATLTTSVDIERFWMADWEGRL